jgi:hypothetical protein
MQTYGTGYFILKTGSTSFLTGQNNGGMVDLSDRENVTIENEALDGTLHAKVKGVRVGPVITIKQPSTDLQTTLNAKIGTTVNLTPFNDNTAFNFNCVVMSAEPEFEDGTAVIINMIITLKSIGYVNFTPLNIGG